ncbi:T9SS type A sorting domain-containing protein [Carboxylicivirga sp. M1479]|uniref:T9SS type A sorting domain-containing protein n=1 Tax=Carboxylicivirga sp. M1479 TaxID=2594476 RepID=UPI001178AAFA|nr:T9SS type A sorting domain-containing protein [Carboxylicivirga sp. M1479]TRX66361.1 T9SS type A sorting domain-containing protein [Carboxylicivirga sp. M1479]
MRRIILNSTVLLLLICLSAVDLTGQRVYVKTDGVAYTSGADHDSWEDATSDLQEAINSLAVTGGEVWVASGTYTPTESYYLLDPGDEGYDATVESRSISFMMANTVSIIGGFVGDEGEIGARSNYGYGEANATILSGDIGVEDDISDNSYHVVYGIDYTSNTAVLSDVVITEGYADGSDRDGRGGGIQTRNGGTYNNVTLVGNSANLGGGVYAYSGGVFNNCLFVGNEAIAGDRTPLGGGLYAHLTGSEITECEFYNNYSVGRGGAIACTEGTFDKCRIINNVADSHGGGIYSYSDEVTPVATTGGIIKNCLVANNTAWADGGGIYIYSHGTVLNTTVVHNQSNDSGGGVITFDDDENANVTILTNVVIWGNDCFGSPPADQIDEGAQTVLTNCAISDINNAVGTDLINLSEVNANSEGPQFTLLSSYIGRGTTPAERNNIMAADWTFGISSPLLNAGLADLTGVDVGDEDLNIEQRVVQNRIDIGAYELEFYIATIDATGNGIYSPMSSSNVVAGGSVSYDFTPDANHQIYTFTVNGENRIGELVEDEGVFTYNVSNINENLDIVVVFASLTEHTIEVTGDAGGDVTPSGVNTIYEGFSLTVDIDPSTGFDLRSILIDGEEQIENVTDNGDDTYSYIFENVDASHTVVVDFALIHTLTVTTAVGGVASPTGDVTLLEGNEIDITITPDLGYAITAVNLDNVDVLANIVDNTDGTYTYTVSGLTDDAVLDIEFTRYYTINITISAGGSASHIDEHRIIEGEELDLMISPESQYKITEIQLDGTDVSDLLVENEDGSYSYAVKDLTADATLNIVFQQYYLLDITASPGGAVSHVSPQELFDDEFIDIVLTPEGGNEVSTLTLNGSDVSGDLIDNNDGTFTITVGILTENSTLEIGFGTSTSIDMKELAAFKIYPNPVYDVLNITGDVQQVQFYNGTGSLVKVVNQNQLASPVNVSDLAKGVYILNVLLPTGESKTHKLIVK